MCQAYHSHTRGPLAFAGNFGDKAHPSQPLSKSPQLSAIIHDGGSGHRQRNVLPRVTQQRHGRQSESYRTSQLPKQGGEGWRGGPAKFTAVLGQLVRAAKVMAASAAKVPRHRTRPWKCSLCDHKLDVTVSLGPSA